MPGCFFRVYNGAAHAQADMSGLSRGANCQRFAVELLTHLGYEVAPIRSSELCDDRTSTRCVSRMRRLEILTLNCGEMAWGRASRSISETKGNSFRKGDWRAGHLRRRDL